MFGISLRREKRCYGLHILDKEVRLVEIVNGSKHISIAQKHVFALEEGIIQNGKIVDDNAVAKQIESYVNQLGLDGVKIHLTIPASNVLLRKTAFPSVNDKSMRNLIDVELNSGSQIPFKSPVFDFIRLGKNVSEEAEASESGSTAKKQEQLRKEDITILATPMELVDSYANIIDGAGLRLVSVEIPGLSLYRIMARHCKITGEMPTKRFVLLHMEQSHADISIFTEGSPDLFRTIPNTADYIFNTSNDPIAAYGQRLSMEISRLLNYFKFSTATGDQEIMEMYVTGAKEYIDYMPNVLRQIFEGEIRKFPLDFVLQSNDANNYPFAVAIGLAMRG